MGAAAVAFLQLATASAPLERCRSLDKEFDTRGMVAPCGAAAEDATLKVAERVEALRLLAFAHLVNGDEALAEPAFLKMLVLSPQAELPADAGTRFKEVFARVRQRFDVDGAIGVHFVAPPAETAAPVQLQVDLDDRLGRVVSARVRAHVGTGAPVEDRLARAELGPGVLRFAGPVPEPVASDGNAAHAIDYEVILEGWDGSPVPVATPITGQLTRAATPLMVAEGEVPWLWIGAGSAAVVGVAAVTGGVLGWCFLAGPCRTQEAWVRVQVKDGNK